MTELSPDCQRLVTFRIRMLGDRRGARIPSARGLAGQRVAERLPAGSFHQDRHEVADRAALKAGVAPVHGALDLLRWHLGELLFEPLDHPPDFSLLSFHVVLTSRRPDHPPRILPMPA